MSGVNKVIIVGRLGADPEIKSVNNGQSVARLSIATSEVWMDKQNQKQERTEWHRVVVWGKAAENAGKYLAKGRQVYVEGRLQTRSWDKQAGTKAYATEIVANNLQYLGDGGATNNNSGGNRDFGPEPQFDAADEIPF